MRAILQWLAAPGHVRAGVFFGLLALLLALEARFPRRTTDPQRRRRWPANFGLVAIDSGLLLLMPLVAMSAAVLAQRQGLGLFNWLQGPPLVEGLAAWLLLDLAIYWQHRWLHEIRWLWPIHRVHHSDVEFDTTTGLRFHPFEILGSMGFKIVVVVALGAAPLAVLVFETLLSSFSLFTHANLRLPARLEAALRRVVVTPEMHRVHHSIHRDETDSNYGNVLSAWDRLFRSYRAQPRDGHVEMRIGLPEYRDPTEQGLWPLLAQPLINTRKRRG